MGATREILIGCCAIVAFGAVGFADTYTYTYTGQDYQFAQGAYTTSERVTGEVTVAAPLATGLALNTGVAQPFTVLSFSFSDGVQTITNASPDLTTSAIDIGTNAAGLPVQWSVDLYQRVVEGYLFFGGSLIPQYGFNQILTTDQTNFKEDWVFNGYSPRGGSGWLGENSNDPGTWTLTVNPTPAAATPEPSSIALVATGMLGMAGWVRRRGKGQAL